VQGSTVSSLLSLEILAYQSLTLRKILCPQFGQIGSGSTDNSIPGACAASRAFVERVGKNLRLSRRLF
jgi:hypothetical protein